MIRVPVPAPTDHHNFVRKQSRVSTTARGRGLAKAPQSRIAKQLAALLGECRIGFIAYADDCLVWDRLRQRGILDDLDE